MFKRLAGTVKSISDKLLPGKAAEGPSQAHEAVEALTEASKQAVNAHGTKSSELRDTETKLKLVQKLLDQVCPSAIRLYRPVLMCSSALDACSLVDSRCAVKRCLA